MKVFLLKDVEQVGLKGEILNVSTGFGMNFLMPRKMAVKITKNNEKYYQQKAKSFDNRKEIIATETSMLAEKIKGITLTIKHKTHDEGKLYSSVSPAEIVDAMAEKGIKISKSQVEFAKSIKQIGDYEVTIKLSSRLKPRIKLHVVSE